MSAPVLYTQRDFDELVAHYAHITLATSGDRWQLELAVGRAVVSMVPVSVIPAELRVARDWEPR